ncbi:MAG TPA: hypothetical protein VKF17_16155 [Isosphaeraceae bacterium]|nr:hypothetical protein [Isosphaeraceae bacterium]
MLRFIRLQGKQVVESVYDPALNSIFVAWDVLVPKYAAVEWQEFREERPPSDPAFNHRLRWHEIAPRPSAEAEAWGALTVIVDRHEGRLKELLARNEAIEAVEDPDWADRAALDCSLGFERHRRFQSAKTRELLRTLDMLQKMRNAECGTRNGEFRIRIGEWAGRNGRWQMPDGRWQMPDGGGRTPGGGGRTPGDG